MPIWPMTKTVPHSFGLYHIALVSNDNAAWNMPTKCTATFISFDQKPISAQNSWKEYIKQIPHVWSLLVFNGGANMYANIGT